MPAKSTMVPPPTEGWDTQNALADMPIKRAAILDNWFPSTDKITVRPGHDDHATGMTSNVESLLPYVSPSGTKKMFAANDGKLYDASTSGAVPAASASGFSNNRWQSVQIGTPGGHFMLAMNGEDAPQIYNGSSISSASITGPTATNLVWNNLHQRRLWFGEKNSLSAWYLEVNSIAGAATEFPLAAIAKNGGYVVGMGTWTRDAGDGSDDVAVFVTSEGEAIVYQGTDPASSTTWALIGRWDIGRPIGRRCIHKDGADLVIVTEQGVISAAKSLIAGAAQMEATALSAQINKAFNDAARSGSTLFGWQPFIYPKGSMFIFNVPQSGSTFHQYVFNTLTRAPCRFTGMNATCWGMLDNDAYFGGTDGKVYKFDRAYYSDNGVDISADALQAFSTFGSPTTQKAFKRVEPIFQSNGDPNAALDLNIDYQIRRPTASAVSSPSPAAKWGISKWGRGKWGTSDQVFRGWRGIAGIGRSAALRVRVDTQRVRPSLVATNFSWVTGGMP